jgi:HEAT repeat protein
MIRYYLFPLLVMAAAASGCRRSEQGPLLSGGREVHSWVAELRDPKPKVRRQAVLKLGNVGGDDPEVAEGLALALHDSDVLVRRDAVHAVVKLKQPSEAMLARLRAMNATDPDATVRDFAQRALAKLGRLE